MWKRVTIIVLLVLMVVSGLLFYNQVHEITHFDLIHHLEDIKYLSEMRMQCFHSAGVTKRSIYSAFESVRLSQETIVNKMIGDLQKRKSQKVYQIVYDNFKSINEADYEALIKDVDQKFNNLQSAGICNPAFQTKQAPKPRPDDIKGGLKDVVIENVIFRLEQTRIRPLATLNK